MIRASFLAALLLLPDVPDAASMYDARVQRVVDGDTFEARVDIWPGVQAVTLVRVYGVDTPEIHGKCEREKLLAQDAKRFVEQRVSSGVTLVDARPDKYGGRVVARVSVRGRDLGELLVEAGLARVYYGETKTPWCSE